MGSRLVERRLRQVGRRLRELREELRVVEEQHAQLADEADDLSLRSLVAETPIAGQEFREAKAHADAMAAHRVHLLQAIHELEARQDELLDALAKR